MGLALSFAAALALGACDSLDDGDGSGAGSRADAGADAGAGAGAGDEACVAARALGSCCGRVEAVTREELWADPCLAPLTTESSYLESSTAQCPAQTCDPEACTGVQPSSRVTARNAGGFCVLTDECANDDDCVELADDRACNCCQTVGPDALTGLDWPELRCDAPPQCAGVDCAASEGPPACKLGRDGLRHCTVAPDSCEAREDEAQAWVAQHAECDEDGDCRLIGLDAQCLPAFLCTTAVRAEGIDVDVLQQGAREMVDRYEAECPGCIVADCGDPERLRPVCRQGTCGTEPID